MKIVLKATIVATIGVCFSINSQEKITTENGGILSYDPNYYVHAYSQYNTKISEARFLNFGHYGHRWDTRVGTAMVIKGNNNMVGIGHLSPEQGQNPDTNRKFYVHGGITLKNGGILSYDPNYYVHAYSQYNTNIPEARFLNFGHYGHRWDTRVGTAMVIKGNTSNIGIGTINPGSWKLAVNGKIRAKEIKVETGWADFVFYDDYKLPTLKEVENHIKEKGHLKDIPSATEVEKNGILIGEMNTKLLQKIEELTLYTIEQEKKIQALEEQAKEIKELKQLISSLLENKK